MLRKNREVNRKPVERAENPRALPCSECDGLGVVCLAAPGLKRRRAWEDFSRGGSWRDIARCRACAAGALWLADEGWHRFRPACVDCGARAEWGCGDEARCSTCDRLKRATEQARTAIIGR